LGRSLWCALVLVCVVGVLVWADAGCGCPPAEQPQCYETFRSNEIIAFSLTLPVDYFWCHGVTETPLITGWRVEAQDGAIVRDEPLSWPTGSWATFAWDLTNDVGELVGPGFYRVVVYTDLTAPISADVLIEPCRSCSAYWSCWPCCPTLCCLCSCQPLTRCRVPMGEPYLELRNGGERSCCGLTVHLYGAFGITCP